jgi:prepilin-type N-terminal cleavage/methylation domain-containing protein
VSLKRSRSVRAFSLVELMVVMAIIGLTLTFAAPAFREMRKAAAMRNATRELRSIFHLTRMRAVSRSRHCAVKFRLAGGEWQYAIHDDGDGDGVRNNDITSGVDPIVAPMRPVLLGIGDARIGIPFKGTTDPDSGAPLLTSDSPVRFNVSTLCSFSPTGTGTPGTVFVTDGDVEVGAVRVVGATGRIRTMRFNRTTGKWENR